MELAACYFHRLWRGQLFACSFHVYVLNLYLWNNEPGIPVGKCALRIRVATVQDVAAALVCVYFLTPPGVIVNAQV